MTPEQRWLYAKLQDDECNFFKDVLVVTLPDFECSALFKIVDAVFPYVDIAMIILIQVRKQAVYLDYKAFCLQKTLKPSAGNRFWTKVTVVDL